MEHEKEHPGTDREEAEVPAKQPTGDEDEERDTSKAEEDAFVDETSKDSFPTSDPPAW